MQKGAKARHTVPLLYWPRQRLKEWLSWKTLTRNLCLLFTKMVGHTRTFRAICRSLWGTKFQVGAFGCRAQRDSVSPEYSDHEPIGPRTHCRNCMMQIQGVSMELEGACSSHFSYNGGSRLVGSGQKLLISSSRKWSLCHLPCFFLQILYGTGQYLFT